MPGLNMLNSPYITLYCVRFSRDINNKLSNKQNICNFAQILQVLYQ